MTHGRFGNSLDVVSQDLSVSLRASLSESFSSFTYQESARDLEATCSER